MMIAVIMNDFQGGEKSKDQKTLENKKKRKKESQNADDTTADDMDLDCMDWWSKYHASMETMIRVCLLPWKP